VFYTKTLKKYFSDGLQKLGLANVYYYSEWTKTKPKVKYLIVDECQDFTAEQISEMCSTGEICFFFGDTEQSIMGFNGPLQTVQATANHIGVMMEPLYYNYRLTKENAMLAEVVGKVEDVVEKTVRNGEKPQAIRKDSIDAQLDEIIKIIKNKSLSNVGILMPFNTKQKASSRTGNIKLSVEYVKEYFIQKGVAVEFKYSANLDTEMDLDFHSSNPKIMTWWCAKGLQFKDVFIPCSEVNYEEEKRAAVYVAMTRTGERLYISYTGKLSSFFPEPTNGLYASTDEIEMI